MVGMSKSLFFKCMIFMVLKLFVLVLKCILMVILWVCKYIELFNLLD